MADVRQTTKTRSGRGSLRDTPAAPTGVVATPTSATTILIDWNTPYSSTAKTTAISGWKVYRSLTTGSGFSLRATVTVSQYEDTVIEGVTYYYKVTAVGINESSYSAEVSATAQGDYQAPAWTIPDLVGVDASLGAVIKGGTASLASYYSANDGTPYFTISSITAAGGSDTSGITINSSTGTISVSETTPSDTYDVVVGLGTSADADWLSRTVSGPYANGVRWYHSFDTQAEIDLYTSTTSNPQTVRVASGGVDGGAYLECRPKDNGDGTWNYGSNVNEWRRPYTPDPHALGYTPGSNSWGRDHYSHPDYAAAGTGNQGTAAYRTNPHNASNEFYVQAAVLAPPERFIVGAPGGKTAWFATAFVGLTPSREILIYTDNPFGTNYTGGYLAVQTDFNKSIEYSPTGLVNDKQLQPYGEFDHIGGTAVSRAAACTYANGGACWQWPGYFGRREWVTVLFHVIPGHCYTTENGGSSSGYIPTASIARDTTIEVFVADGGRYRKIVGGQWSMDQYSNAGTSPRGWNAFIAASYQNTGSDETYFALGYDQIIFSERWIPPPNWNPALEPGP